MWPVVEPEQQSVRFTPDEEFLLFWTSVESKSLFTVWDTRQKKAIRTFKSVSDVGPMAPDGETLLASDDAGNLRIGEPAQRTNSAPARLGGQTNRVDVFSRWSNTGANMGRN